MRKILLFLVAVFATFVSYSQASNYIFAPSSGTYTQVSGSATAVSAVVADDAYSASIPLGFTFNFNGTDYTSVFANSNGFLTFSSTATATASQQRSNTSANIANIGPSVLALWDDEIGFSASPASSYAGYEVTGSAGSRVFTFEWRNWVWYYSSTNVAAPISFQVKLYETTNVIEFVYRQEVASIVGTSASATIGIAASSTNYLTLSGSDANPTASSSTFTTSIATKPATGQVYKFTPPAPCVAPTAQPTSLTLTPSSSAISISFTAASPTVDKYLIVRTPGVEALNTLPSNGVTYTAGGTLGNGTIVSVANSIPVVSTGLSLTTGYTYTIFAVNHLCSGGPLYLTTSPLTGSSTTLSQQTYVWQPTTGTQSFADATQWNPNRTIADASDILMFTNGGTSTATGVTTQTVGRVIVSNNTSISLQSSATATLTIASDGTATDELNIASGSSLILNSTAAALTLTYSGTGSTGTIAGTAEVTSTSGALVNTFTFSGGTTPVTTVTSTGVLAAGQNGGTGVPVITGTASTLIINGVYNHKFQVAAGTIPTATWNTGSKVNIIGYTATVTAGPSGFGQTFYDVEWNCPSQTTNIACAGTVPSTNGTFTITSTGAGSNYLSLTATTAYTKTWASFVQTGGILDLGTGSSGANTISITGTFNQSGGTFKSTGTSTSSTTLNFSSTTTQSVTFTGQPSGPIIYRISATNGITLNANIASFVIGNGTLGGVRVSTTAAIPITLGGSITSLQYATLNSTLTYDATGSYSMTATEYPAASGPANLTIAVGTGNVIIMPGSFGSRSLSPTGASGILTMTSGDLDLGANTFTLGTSASFPGTLTYTAGSIRVTTGSLTRWFGTSSLPTSAGTSVGYFPLASGANNRNVQLYFSTTTALSTGGTITVGHSNASGTSSVNVVDGAYTIEQQTNAYWPLSSSGIVASGTISARITGGGLLSTTGTNLRLMQNGAVAGTFVASGGTAPNFYAVRTGLSVASISQNQYIGAANADLGYLSIATGNWEDGGTWNKGTAPTSADAVAIASGHTVTVNAVAANASSLTINSGGTLSVNGSTLTVANTVTNFGTVSATGGTISIIAASTTGITNNSGAIFTVNGSTINLGPTDNSFCNRTFTNNGTLTVSSGNLNVYGNINNANASTFNQSGGTITVDGNAAGVLANSVAGGTNIFGFGTSGTGATLSLTGGTIIIVDPHTVATAAGGTSNGHAFMYWGSGYRSGTGHTIQIGNGVSTDAGGNTSGYQYDPWPGAGYFIAGNLVVNAPTGTNRSVTEVYSTGVEGNLTITSGELLATSTLTKVGGNLTVNTPGILTSTTSLVLALWGSDLTSSSSNAASTNAQTISGSGTFRNLATSPTANFTSLTVNNSNTNGVTFAAGLTPSVSAATTITAGSLNADALSLTGASAQTVALTAATSLINVQNFTLNNSAGATLSGSGFLNVTGTVNVTAGVLASAGRLTLKSTATTNARVASVAAGAITGSVNVERYFPGKRAFRFLGHPFSASIALSQLMTTNGANTGIDVTGAGGATNGFTATVTNNPSAFNYTPASGNSATNPDPGWNAIGSASATNWAAKQGLRVFVRGTKGEGLNGAAYTPSATTVTMSGTLNDGSSPVFTLGNGASSDYNLIANPLASTIDMQALTLGGDVAGSSFYVWDVSQGAAGAYVNEPFASAATYRYLPLGSAFFARSASGAGTITFSEAAKVSNTPASILRGTSKYGNNSIQLVLNDNAGVKHDRILFFFNKKAFEEKDNMDGEKMTNPGVNFYSNSKDSKKLSIDVRPLTDNTIIPLTLNTPFDKEFTITAEDFNLTDNKDVLLHDKKTDTYTKLSAGVSYSFTSTLSDATTYGNRFELITKVNPSLLVENILDIKLSPNPVKDVLTINYSTPNATLEATTIIKITNNVGQIIENLNFGATATGSQKINMSKYAKGVYTIELVVGKEKVVKQIVKQ